MKKPLKLIPWNDSRLDTPSKRVEKITPEIFEFIQDLKEAMVREKGVGIAAPQVGRNLRIIIVDLSPTWDGSQITALVNPFIHRASIDTTMFEEGCLSFPGLFIKIERPQRVAVKAWDEHGEDIVIEASLPVSVCIQHEVDHLDGITFLKRVNHERRKNLLQYWRREQNSK